MINKQKLFFYPLKTIKGLFKTLTSRQKKKKRKANSRKATKAEWDKCKIFHSPRLGKHQQAVGAKSQMSFLLPLSNAQIAEIHSAQSTRTSPPSSNQQIYTFCCRQKKK